MKLPRWLLVCAPLLACCTDEEAAPASSPSPAPTSTTPAEKPSTLSYKVDELGPFRVGHRTIKTTYQPINGLPARTITVHLWYPTLDSDGTQVKYLSFLDKKAFEGASLAPPVEAEGYPVHIHSHGMWGFAGNSADMMRWFASHGWVAAAPDHAGNTLSEKKDGIPANIYYQRALDMPATLDALEKLDAGDPLAGKLRTKKVSLSGHSFGTHTVWLLLGARYDRGKVDAACAAEGKFSEPCAPGDAEAMTQSFADPRVVAGIPMAGTPLSWMNEGDLDAATRPVLQMSAAGDQVGADKVWAAVSKLDFSWAEFEGGCHQLFGLGGCADYKDDEGFKLVDTYGLAFARKHVLGDAQARTSDILAGRASLSGRVMYQHKEGTP